MIRTESRGAVRRVTLADPERHNALTPPLCAALAEALEAAAADASVRCVLLDAEGRAFCVGADLKQAAAAIGEALPALVRAYHRCSEAVYFMAKPVVAAIQGVAAGGGFSLAIASDVRIMSETASMQLAYPRVGLAMDGGSSWRLPRLIGRAAAEEFLFRSPTVTAAQAKSMGLVHEVAPPERLAAVALDRATELAAGPTFAFAQSKALLNPRAEIRAALEAEAKAMEATARSSDGREGIAAFLGKRPPNFQGR